MARPNCRRLAPLAASCECQVAPSTAQDDFGWTMARTGAVLDQAVDVRAFGAVGDAAAHQDRDDTGAIQAALDTGENVYLPRGSYRITQTLRFHDQQTIFGDAKGPDGVGTELLVRGGIHALRSVEHPALARDVLIRDLAIQNEDTKNVPGGSAGIDFTGVGFSRIERVSIRYHEYGIIGRDSTAYSTTVRADSSGTVLKVPAERPDAPYPDFAAVGAALTVTDGHTASVVRVAAQAGRDHPDYPALLLDRALLITYHPGAWVYPAPIGGYYNSVMDCELVNCRRGLWLSQAGNAWTLLDGRVSGNDYGVYAEHCTGNRFRGTFEGNGVGVLLKDAPKNFVMSGSYFEGYGKPEVQSALGRW
jgi:hypothetical protein